MDMIEKVARALYAIRMEVAEGTGIHEPYSWETDNNAYREHCLREARAAIEALMVPTDEMIDAGIDRLLQDGNSVIDRDAQFCWQAMLHAALTPSPASK